jgi:Fur family peroxide stress response transcriptional regulator
MRAAEKERRQTAHQERYERMVADLRRAKLKLTPQRLAIVRLFSVDESHPTAQDLYARLQSTFPTMSFATVYNTLDALASAGLSGTLHLGGASRFDPNTDAHHHAICDVCGKIVDVPASAKKPKDESPPKVVRASPGFRVRAVERVYRGVCATCSKARAD